MKMICELCEKEIPDKFLSQMACGGGYALVDPECALAITNEIHGIKLKKFKGECAQQLLEDFRKWRRKNGE
jgi:hypothetical protein